VELGEFQKPKGNDRCNSSFVGKWKVGRLEGRGAVTGLIIGLEKKKGRKTCIKGSRAPYTKGGICRKGEKRW